MPPQRTLERSKPRQDPVSCQYCRSKKLRCDRNQPCSNCQSRGLACEYERPLPISHPSEDLRAENRAIKARLEKLEGIVFSTQRTFPWSAQNPAPGLPVASTPRNKLGNEAARIETQFLEAVEPSAGDVLPQFTDTFWVDIRAISDSELTAEQAPGRKIVSLPPREIIVRLLDTYSEYLDPVQHVMHIPSVRNALDPLYEVVRSGQVPNPGIVALLLAIAASVGFYWPFYDPLEQEWGTVFANAQVAVKVFTIWLREALTCVEHARISSQPSIEATQATTLLMFLLYHLEGFSARTRMLHASNVAMARDLQLHKIDSANGGFPETTPAEIVAAEIARRVWWHIASTDWLLGFTGGPNEGTYSINPRHMMVNKPRNLNPHELSSQAADFRRELTEPSIMSYYLHRIQLSEICREAIDTLWDTFFASDPADTVYENVIALDAKFDALLNELPRFMRLDIPSARLKLDYGNAYNSSIALQRAMIHLMIHTRRCKLHLPFLVRTKSHERFAFSRNACLRAARAVFDVRHAFWEDRSGGQRSKIGGILHHFFYATMVLVLDLCVNNRNDHAQLTEARDALTFMEEAKGSSRIANVFFEHLTEVLSKHNVNLPLKESYRIQRLPQPAPTTNFYEMPEHRPGQQGQEGGTHILDDLNLPSDAFCDALWQDFLNDGQNMGAQDWDAFLNDLEMRVG